MSLDILMSSDKLGMIFYAEVLITMVFSQLMMINNINSILLIKSHETISIFQIKSFEGFILRILIF